MNDSKFTLLPSQVTKTMAAFLNERLNVRQKAELRELLGTGTGGGGDMTGEEIAEALDAALGSAEWRSGETTMTGEEISEALDTLLGSAWRETNTGPSGPPGIDSGNLRPYVINKMFDSTVASSAYGLSYQDYNKVYLNGAVNPNQPSVFGKSEWGIPDGVTELYVSGIISDQLPSEYGFSALPASLLHISSDGMANSATFRIIINAIGNSPLYYAYNGVLDFFNANFASAGDDIFDPDTQTIIENLMGNGWTIYAPNGNMPITPNPIPSFPSYTSALGSNYFAVGNAEEGLGITGELWACSSESDPNDPSNWYMYAASEWYPFPKRFNSGEFESYITFTATLGWVVYA